MAEERLNFMLMGTTGQGKSATGNMLLNRRVFKTSPNSKSQTKEVDSSFAQFKDNILLVVDGPGLQDTDMDKVRDKELAVKNMDKALALCYGGVNAFLFTIKFCTRFTPEKRATLESLKKIFGKDYMKFLIVIVTYGDLFQQAMEEQETDMSFEDWCKKQEGVFRQLYAECNGRFVLFNNRTKVQQERESQIQQLISLTRALKNQYGTYTSQCFEKAEYERNKLIVDLKAPELTRAIQERLSLLTADIEVYSKQPSVIHKEQLVKRIQNLKEEIVFQDKGYNVLTNLLKNVKEVEENLGDADELQRLAVEMENTRKAKTFWRELRDVLVHVGGAFVLVAPPVGAVVATGAAVVAGAALAAGAVVATGAAVVAGISLAAGGEIVNEFEQITLDSNLRKMEEKEKQIREKRKE